MELHPLRLVLVLASVAVLAACTGATGTVEDDAKTDSQTGAQASGDATTSGTGDETISTSGGAVASGTGEAATQGDDFAGHALDNPAGSLATRTIYFAFDSSEVPEPGLVTIEAHSRYLAEHPGALITLEGHADERGSREYNIALGERRALAVRQLMTLLGATQPQIRTISYGEERPATVGHDESTWQLNRRVEIIYRVRE